MEPMYRSTKDLIGKPINGRDGIIGKTRDFLFNDDDWVCRYLVADTTGWLTRKQVLIAPHLLRDPDLGAWDVAVHANLDRDMIRACPPLEAHEPVSRQYERELAMFYSYPLYWDGLPVGTSQVASPGTAKADISAHLKRMDQISETRLRSVGEVLGYHIAATDGEIGHVEDFIVETKVWTLRYLVVDTRNWLPGGRKVLIPPFWQDDIDWRSQRLRVTMTRDAVRQSPEIDLNEPVNRDAEGRLYDYYGLPRDW